MAKSMEGTPKNKTEKAPDDPLESFTKEGAVISTESKAPPTPAKKAAQ